MRQLACVVLSGLLLVLVGCGKKDETKPGTGGGPEPSKKQEAAKDKPQDLIVGVWEIVTDDPKKKSTVEFKPGDDVVLAMEGLEMKGKYKFVEDEVIEVKMKPPVPPDAKEESHKSKVKVTKDDLSITDLDGPDKDKETKFKKKK